MTRRAAGVSLRGKPSQPCPSGPFRLQFREGFSRLRPFSKLTLAAPKGATKIWVCFAEASPGSQKNRNFFFVLRWTSPGSLNGKSTLMGL
jgi:hypothetical protein